MARRTGTEPPGAGKPGEDDDLGLPDRGPGSLASFPSRLLAYAVDSVASTLIAGLFINDPADPRRGLLTLGVFALQYLLLGSTSGHTLGMRLVGMRIVRLDAPDAPPGVPALAIRTALLVLLVPALLIGRDGRGLHDRAAGTAVLRSR